MQKHFVVSTAMACLMLTSGMAYAQSAAEPKRDEPKQQQQTQTPASLTHWTFSFQVKIAKGGVCFSIASFFKIKSLFSERYYTLFA